jgi:hypothetical protein
MNQTQFMHFRPTNVHWNCRGGLTIAIYPLDQEDSVASETPVAGKIAITFAECSKRDVFDRKLGRTIAAGRMRAFLDGRAFDRQTGHQTMIVEVPEILDDSKFKSAAALALSQAGLIDHLE